MSEERKKTAFGRTVISITGRVGTQPETQEFEGSNGKFPVTTFRLVNSPFRGGREPLDQWYTVRVVGGGTKFAQQLNKGDVVTVDGSFETREFTNKDGEARFVAEIQAHPGPNSINRNNPGKITREAMENGGEAVAADAGSSDGYTEEDIPF